MPWFEQQHEQCAVQCYTIGPDGLFALSLAASYLDLGDQALCAVRIADKNALYQPSYCLLHQMQLLVITCRVPCALSLGLQASWDCTPNAMQQQSVWLQHSLCVVNIQGDIFLHVKSNQQTGCDAFAASTNLQIPACAGKRVRRHAWELYSAGHRVLAISTALLELNFFSVSMYMTHPAYKVKDKRQSRHLQVLSGNAS